MTSVASTPPTAGARVEQRAPSRLFALVAGLTYALVGLGGCIVTGLGQSVLLPHATLVIFSVNPLHNAVHLLLGVAWLVGTRNDAWAKGANVAIGMTLGLVTVLGFGHALGFLGISGLADPDNFLHLATATLALYFGTVGAERTAALAATVDDMADRPARPW